MIGHVGGPICKVNTYDSKQRNMITYHIIKSMIDKCVWKKVINELKYKYIEMCEEKCVIFEDCLWITSDLSFINNV